MSCRSVEQWLDRGMPVEEREDAMRHVAVCGACSEAFEAASGVEKALRHVAATAWAAPAAAAVPPAPEFVANVMSRVAAAESLGRGSQLERRRGQIWISLVTDPLSVISITAALLVAVWGAWHPRWFFDAGMTLAARSWWSAAALAPRGGVVVDPLILTGIAIAVTPLAIWTKPLVPTLR